MEEKFSTKNLATIIQCNGAILWHRFALYAFSYDMDDRSMLYVGRGVTTGEIRELDDQTLATYSRRNEEMLRHRLPKIAAAYRELGKEEKARKVLLELDDSTPE